MIALKFKNTNLSRNNSCRTPKERWNYVLQAMLISYVTVEGVTIFVSFTTDKRTNTYGELLSGTLSNDE